MYLVVCIVISMIHSHAIIKFYMYLLAVSNTIYHSKTATHCLYVDLQY